MAVVAVLGSDLISSAGAKKNLFEVGAVKAVPKRGGERREMGLLIPAEKNSERVIDVGEWAERVSDESGTDLVRSRSLMGGDGDVEFMTFGGEIGTKSCGSSGGLIVLSALIDLVIVV